MEWTLDRTHLAVDLPKRPGKLAYNHGLNEDIHYSCSSHHQGTERPAQRRRNRAAVLRSGTEGANWCALLLVRLHNANSEDDCRSASGGQVANEDERRNKYTLTDAPC
jgi:hypothetical protein